MDAVFALPDRLAAKADPCLVAVDEQHFTAVARSLQHSVADLEARLEEARRVTARHGTAALERDQEVHRLQARLRTLRRFRLDLCLGRMDPEDGEPVYVGRLGLSDGAGRRLLVDWRSPAAEPFFAATHATPLGLASRRRYRWTHGRITDYWDEVFTAEGFAGHAAALDDQSAFLASLGSSRTGRMRDVLGTIQADQDAIVRAGSRGPLVVDGGPGTGKTVVALHRTAYLLYSDPRLGHRRGGVLFVGPHRPYLAYVADVLPSLGEDGVQTCTLRDLVPEGAVAVDEPDPAVAALKSSADLVRAIEPAVSLYEELPSAGTQVETPWADLWLSTADWAEAFEAVDPGTPHNDAREDVREALVQILLDQVADDPEVPHDLLRRGLARHGGLARELDRALDQAWTLLDPLDLVGDLWTVPAYLRMCAPWLTPEQVRALQREDPRAWTTADLPLLDAARQRLGDPGAGRRRARREAALAERREEMSHVVDQLVSHDDSEMQLMSMLRGEDLQTALDDPDVVAGADPDLLAGPFAHVVVDEAQELTDAEWQMLLLRCPSRSLTIVGDRAQARSGFPESWEERLARVGLPDVRIASLSVNYRTPAEVMAEAEPVIRAALPDANVPISIRRSGLPVVHGSITDLEQVVADWEAAHPDGIGCVIGHPSYAGTDRVRALTPALAKGLEFDLVVLVDPQAWSAVDRYVAMTRATQQLVVMTQPSTTRLSMTQPSMTQPSMT